MSLPTRNKNRASNKKVCLGSTQTCFFLYLLVTDRHEQEENEEGARCLNRKRALRIKDKEETRVSGLGFDTTAKEKGSRRGDRRDITRLGINDSLRVLVLFCE